MKPESLHALIIDHHAGELSPEAVELLELHLSQNAAARSEAEIILRALSVTHDTLMRHPELAHVTLPLVKTVPHTRQRAAWMTVLARAAAVALLAAAAGAGGFVAGRSGTPVADAPVMASAAPAAAPSKQSPWARYQVSFDPTRSGMTVVRVANSALPTP